MYTKNESIVSAERGASIGEVSGRYGNWRHGTARHAQADDDQQDEDGPGAERDASEEVGEDLVESHACIIDRAVEPDHVTMMLGL